MVTLLLTFFVLLFAISSVDQQKVMLLFAGFSREGLSAQRFTEITEMFAPGGDMEGDFPIYDDSYYEPEEPAEGGEETAPDDTAEMGNPELEALYERLNLYIETLGLSDYISVLYNGEFLLLTLANDIWFMSGSADVSLQMRQHAVMIARLLADNWIEDKPFEIVVAGHTDNVPIHSARYPNNWYLSVDRAVNVISVLLSETELDPMYFSARGYGSERPIDTNDTDRGRQANRRVEIMISLLKANEAIPR